MEKASSAKVNWDKSKALLIGPWGERTVPRLPGNLQWGKRGIHFLGVFLELKRPNWEGVEETRCGGTVAQCLALLPHSKKVVGSSPASCNMSGLVPGPFCVEFACSPRVHPGFPP